MSKKNLSLLFFTIEWALCTLFSLSVYATPLTDAVKHGNIEETKRLIHEHQDVNQSNEHGSTPLMLAALYGRSEIVKLLLEHRAEVNLVDKKGSNALLLASLSGYKEAMAYMNHGEHVDLGSRDDNTSVALATEIVEMLLKHGAKVNDVNEDGASPLLAAVSANRIGLLKILLRRGADVNRVDKYGNSALKLAWLRSNEIPTILLEHGAKVDADSFRNIILSGNDNLLKYAEKHLDHLESTDSMGNTPLLIATKYGKRKVVKYLLDHGANVSHVNNFDETALGLAIRSDADGQQEILRILEGALEKKMEPLFLSHPDTLEKLHEIKNAVRDIVKIADPSPESKSRLEKVAASRLKKAELQIIAKTHHLSSPAHVDTSSEEGDCDLCFTDNVELFKCAAGNPNCERTWCAECAKQSLGVLIENQSKAAVCEDCKKPIRHEFFENESLGCKPEQVNILHEMQLRSQLAMIDDWLFCHNGECPNGGKFPPSTKRFFNCEICHYEGCLDCGLNHKNCFDADGKCKGDVVGEQTLKRYAMLEKQGKLERKTVEELAGLAHKTVEELNTLAATDTQFPRDLNNQQKMRLIAIKAIKSATPAGTPCPICSEEIGPNHSVAHHKYDCKFRPCPWCGMMTEKNEACNHMICANPNCHGDPQGRKDYSWRSGDMHPTSTSEPDAPMNHPNDIRNKPGFKSWWPGQDRPSNAGEASSSAGQSQ